MTDTTKVRVASSRLAPVRVILVAALLLAAVGIVVQILGGVSYPPVPPGLFILVVPAVLIAAIRWRWIPLLGLLAATFLTIGMIAAGTHRRLISPQNFGPFLGTWFQLIGQVVALVAAIVAVILAARSTRSAE